VMQVYGLSFCEVHGEEAKAGALEELYYDASVVFERQNNPHAELANPEALRVLEAGHEELVGASVNACHEADAAARRAYPFRRDLMDDDFRDFDYAGGEEMAGAYPLPEDWCRYQRIVLHKLMRTAFAEEATYVLDNLEKHREHVAAQLAYVLHDRENKLAAAKS
jgi:hypothetical protein